jgi:hypothetical protein
MQVLFAGLPCSHTLIPSLIFIPEIGHDLFVINVLFKKGEVIPLMHVQDVYQLSGRDY